jgi:gas vesicle protein
MSTKSKTGAFLTGAVFGSLIGGTIALLFAPQTGEETRTVIKEKSNELKDRAIETGEEIRHKAEETAAQARTRIEETATVTRERAADLQQRGQSFLDEQRERIKSAIDAGKKSLAKEDMVVAENGVEEPTAEA